MIGFIKAKLVIIQRMKNARAVSGKGYLTQLYEIMRLRKGYTKLTGAQYYDYRLYDDKKFSFSQKREFAGDGICKGFYGTITDQKFVGMAGDKLSAYAVFRGYDLPQPEHYAAITSKSRYCGNLPQLKTRAEVLDFFMGNETFPVFIKPIRGKHGAGAHVIYSFDKDLNRLCIENDNVTDVTTLADDMLDPKFEGFVCQEKLIPHEEIEKIVGDSIASIRFVLLYYADGPRIIRAVLKLPGKGNITDNFHNGDSGNLVAALNTETGVIERVISGEPDNEEELIAHPESGRQLFGMQVPLWNEALDVCKKAAGVFSQVRYQGWDIALTNEGPKILELNVGSHVDLVQRAYGKGIFDAEFQSFVKEYNKPEYQPGRMYEK